MSDHPVNEPPRGFAVLLQQIDDGALHSEVSEALHTLNGQLAEYVSDYRQTAKGELVIRLSLAAHEDGTVKVLGEVKTKAPKKKQRGQLFWMTKGNNLSPESPRQTKLPLREVTPRATEAVDVPVSAAPARGV